MASAVRSPAAFRVVRKMKRGCISLMQRQSAGQGQPSMPGPQGPMGPQGPPGFPGQFVAMPYPYPQPAQNETPKKDLIEDTTKGIEISTDVDPDAAPVVMPKRDHEAKDIRMSYPLIPRNPSQGQRIYAYADIRWDRRTNEIVYYVIEPQISQYDVDVINTVKTMLEERLDIDFFKLGEIKAKDLLREETEKILSMDPNLTQEKRDSINYYIERDIIGLGKLQPLMKDPNIEDISCDGIGIPIYVYHRDPSIGSLKTNVFFTSEDELNSFVIKMAQRARKSISIADPLLDASLPDGSRIQATLGTDIARKGSNFTIRRFAEEPLTPTHMLKYGTLNSTQLAYLWLAVENGQSLLISGGTATGKTSMLNALSLFIRPNLKIVSIEDTPELRLPHPHWIPEVARTPLSIKGTTGEVSLFDLLKSSLRQRPDYIVMGEVRGKEAFVLFQQMASIPGREQVFVINDRNLKRVPIDSVDSARIVAVPTYDLETGKIGLGELKETVKHSPVNELFEIETRTGRQVTVTGNHSLFSEKGEPVIAREIRKGQKILIPSRIPCGFNDPKSISLLGLPGIRVYSPDLIKKAARKLGFEKASKTSGRMTISNYYGVNNCALPSESFIRLMDKAGMGFDPGDVDVRFERKSEKMKGSLEISAELLRFIGYHISEGSLNKAYKNNRISFYNKDEDILDDYRKCVMKLAGKIPRQRETKGFGTSTELSFSNKVIYELLRYHTGTMSNNKRAPDFVFGLSKERIGEFLSGLYSGDSHLNRNVFGYYTTSRQLANDVALLLLSLGIVARISKRKRNGRKTTDYEILFYKNEYKREFLKYVRPIGKKGKNIGNLGKGGKSLNQSDVFSDEIARITKLGLEKPLPVYDLSVPGTQNFIGGFGGILLHNTGHPSIATIHAASITQLVDRLTTPPISLPPSLLENVNVIVFLTLSRIRDKYVRRADNILEISGVQETRPVTKNVFKWDPDDDKFVTDDTSVVLRTISERQALTEDQLKAELVRRKMVMEWLYNQGIYDYREVARIISAYYNNPEKVIDAIQEVE